MKVATFNDVKVYNLSSGKTTPQWLTEAKKRALSKDDDYRRRLELIQDFEMNTAVQCIKMTKDGEHIIITGTYPPCVRCYTVSDLAMKFQRGLTSEVIAFETLSEDFGKLVFLQNDRTLNFHAPYGTHYSVRVPKFGRDLVYGWETCDLYVAGSGDEVYRLNLESGQFREPFKLGFTGCNKLSSNPVHRLLACGGENRNCEFWDSRYRKCASKLVLNDDGAIDSKKSTEITALKFDTDGLTLAVGTSNGNCFIYDIRSSKPLYVKEHQYGLPILDVTFHNSSKHVISTDKKIAKIWERNSGKVLTNVETPSDINSVHVMSDRRGQSGMLMFGGEQSRVMTYFIPQLGPAPRWCSFLEALTEELEESAQQTVYEDYKFITKQEVDDLGASSLVGTPMLKGYMHGYFIEMKLYHKLRAVSKPFEYEEHRRRRIQEKIDEKRQSRIAPRKRVSSKVLAAAKDASGNVDSRFASKLDREEFQVDKESYDFKLRHPVLSKVQSSNSFDNDSEDDDLKSNLKSDHTKVIKANNNNSESDDEAEGDNSDIDVYETVNVTKSQKIFKKKPRRG